MPFVGFLLIAMGAFWVNAAVQNRRPLETLKELIATGDLEGTLAKTKGTGFAPDVVVREAGERVGGILDAAGKLAVPPTTDAKDRGQYGGPQGDAPAVALAYARAQIGKRYSQVKRFGPDSYDCSGLMFKAYEAAGIKIPTLSGTQALAGRAVSRAELLPGDLIWYPGHIMMYAGNNMIVEAPRHGVPVREVPYYKGAAFRRIVG